MFGIGHWELFFILLVVLLLFGAKRIPEMAQGLGRGIKEFRGAMREVQDEMDTPKDQQNTINTTAPSNQVPHGSAADAGATPDQQKTN
jgi:sec-independent protein translocase protein TatA